MAYPPRSILTPVQLDDQTLVALGYAKQLATASGATVHLLHVVEKYPALGEPEISEHDNIREESDSEQQLNALAQQHLGNVKYQVHIVAASPRALAKAVTQIAEDVKADLIVMKTHGKHERHGRTGLTHLLLGSVTGEVVHTAPCPVLTLTQEAQEKAGHLQLQAS